MTQRANETPVMGRHAVMGRHCTIVQMLFKLPSDAQLVQFGRGILLNIVLLESACVERLVGGVCLVGVV